MKEEKLHELSLQASAESLLFLAKEYNSAIKLKTVWISQTVTITGTFFTGLTILMGTKNWISVLGLVFLLLTIVFGLFLIIKNHTIQSNWLLSNYTIKAALHFNLTKYYGLLNIPKPSEEQKKDIKLLEEKISSPLEEKVSIYSEDQLKSLDEKFKEEHIETKNYFLIGGLFIGGILIAISGLLETEIIKGV